MALLRALLRDRIGSRIEYLTSDKTLTFKTRDNYVIFLIVLKFLFPNNETKISILEYQHSGLLEDDQDE